MKLSSIRESRSTLALTKATADVLTQIIYTIEENYDFFSHITNRAFGSRSGRGYTDRYGRYKEKPQLKDRGASESEADWIKRKDQYEKDLERYHRDKKTSKSSSSSGWSTSSDGYGDRRSPQNPYAQAASDVVGAGVAALKSKIAPSVSSASDSLLSLFTRNNLNTAKIKLLLNTAATHPADILNDEAWLKTFFDEFKSLDANARNNILAVTKAGAIRAESATKTACFIIDNYDADLVSAAMKLTSETLVQNGLNITEAGVRQMIDAARRFISQPQAVATTAQQNILKSTNVSNAKLLVQNIIKYFEQRLKAAKIDPNQLAAILNDPTKSQQLRQKLGI